MTKTASKKYKYKFSFVMPIYNVEKYLAEAVESVLNQSMSFAKDCEIIFVNDGSPDNSEEICLHYKNLYPNNIKYIKQKNKGLSAARNRGIKEVEGKYVSFLDSDDMISSDALKDVYDFFEAEYEKIDLVAIKLQYFDAGSGDSPYNYRFTQSRVIDVESYYKFPHFSAAASFVKSETLRKFIFDKEIKELAEDIKFVTQIILDKMAYGVVSKPVYFYRKRKEQTSIMGRAKTNKTWYLVTPVVCHKFLLDYSRKTKGIVPKYVQFLVLTELGARLNVQELDFMSENEIKKFQHNIDSVLRYLDDDIILDWNNLLSPEIRVYLLSRKHKRSLSNEARYHKDGHLYVFGNDVFNARKTPVVVSFMDILDGQIVIEGWYGGFRLDGLKAYVSLGGVAHELRESYAPGMDKYSMGEHIYQKNAFKVAIPLPEQDCEMNPVIEVAGKKLAVMFKFGKFSGINQRHNDSYRVIGSRMVVHKSGRLIIKSKTFGRRAKQEILYISRLAKNNYWRPIGYRLAYYMAKPWFAHKTIWLISDRSYTAGDNADYFFQHVATRKDLPKNVWPIFALASQHPRYKYLKRFGTVVPINSLRFNLLFLLSNKRISSQFDEYIINPFGEERPYYYDLFNFDFVYLQHGVLTSDSSKQFGRFAKNIKLFTAASKYEVDAIISNKDYGYGKGVVKLVGQTRFDPLIDERTNTIIFMPTWRQGIAGNGSVTKQNVPNGRRYYTDTFKDTEYFQFYNSLLKDNRIGDVLEKYNYTIEFYIHPSLSSQWGDFDAAKNVKIMQPPHDYVTAMRRGALMVTDYSGVAFDFAYMKKPLIYTQYDKDTLYQNHYYSKGYFSFEDKGFGPVTYDYEASINEIVKMIESGCRMSSEYRKRVDNFFYKLDQSNSARACDAVIAMPK